MKMNKLLTIESIFEPEVDERSGDKKERLAYLAQDMEDLRDIQFYQLGLLLHNYQFRTGTAVPLQIRMEDRKIGDDEYTVFTLPNTETMKLLGRGNPLYVTVVEENSIHGEFSPEAVQGIILQFPAMKKKFLPTTVNGLQLDEFNARGEIVLGNPLGTHVTLVGEGK
jgi:hypothetical protein